MKKQYIILRTCNCELHDNNYKVEEYEHVFTRDLNIKLKEQIKSFVFQIFVLKQVIILLLAKIVHTLRNYAIKSLIVVMRKNLWNGSNIWV